MELVDTTAEVAPGEPVETSGYQGGLYPAGIPIGTVSRVLNDPSALSKQIWVRPNVDFSKLETVLIILR